MITLSDYIHRINEPLTIMMAKKSRALKATGIDVVDLSLGEPDFQTPRHIKDAAIQALEDGYTKYPPVAGYPELKQAICEKLQRDNGLAYAPENIVVSNGAKQSLCNVIQVLISKDDEAIIPTPFWVTYASQVNLNEGKTVFVSCDVNDGFKLTPEKLVAAITPKTKLLIFSSPCNPSGVVYTKAELAGLVAVLEQHPNIVVISDEIYEYINYNGGHESIAQFDSIKDRVVVINGFSKGYAMTGWRLGYIAAPEIIAKATEKLQSTTTSGPNAMAQRAAIAALLGDMTPTYDMVKAFTDRKAYFISALATIEGFKLVIPDGAFYAFPDVSYYFGKTIQGTVINNASDFALALLEHAHVTGVSGDAFGSPNCIRFSFAAGMDRLEEAVRRIKAFVEA